MDFIETSIRYRLASFASVASSRERAWNILAEEPASREDFLLSRARLRVPEAARAGEEPLDEELRSFLDVGPVCHHDNVNADFLQWHQRTQSNVLAVAGQLMAEDQDGSAVTRVSVAFESPGPHAQVEVRQRGQEAASIEGHQRWAGLFLSGPGSEAEPGALTSFHVRPLQGLLRVGWASAASKCVGDLGKDGLSFGYGGTAKWNAGSFAKFQHFGETYGPGDVVTAIVDRRDGGLRFSFAKNGKNLGEALALSAVDVPESLQDVPLRGAVCGKEFAVMLVAETAAEHSLSQIVAPTTLEPQLSTHFLPKFENEDVEKRLSATIASGRRVLAVTKKHSGSLVMAPPFYAKNSTANIFSRMGHLLLLRHFRAVWPGEADKRWAAWWADAEQNRLCYSFECVVPKVLGSHGATPDAAYVVLTAVSDTRGNGRFLSPIEVLEVATKFRLPLNEAWFVSGPGAIDLEDQLHRVRWTCVAEGDGDAAATELLDKVIAGAGSDGFSYHFLRHGETQGSVLEGFVLINYEGPAIGWLNDFRSLAEKYNETMAPHRDSAKKAVRELGKRCRFDGRCLMQELEAGPVQACGVWEPVRLPSVRPGMVWSLASLGKSPLARMFRVLRVLYGHKVNLHLYRYKGKLQIQIQSKDDNVFFGWRLHQMLGLPPLYRGMVVTLEPNKLCEPVTSVKPVGHSVRIVEVAKLKCLNYLFRTFGIRNQLSRLLDSGPEAYLKKLVPQFFKNWSVPEEHQPRVKQLLSDFASHVGRMSPSQRLTLSNDTYLEILEPFLERRACRERGEPEPDSAVGSRLQGYWVVVANFSGMAVLPSFVEAEIALAGLVRAEDKVSEPISGRFMVTDKPPKNATVVGEVPTVMVVVHPGDDVPDKDPKHKMLKALTRFDDAAVHRIDVTTGVKWSKSMTDADWRTAMDSLPVAQICRREKPARLVVAVACLPPGGGKSTFLNRVQHALGGESCQVVASDHEQDFDNAVVAALQSHTIVCYDKNLPAATGVQKLARVLGKANKDFDIRVALVAPLKLSQEEEDRCWARVRARPQMENCSVLTVHQEGEEKAWKLFKNVFFESCCAFLPTLLSADAVSTTELFWDETASSAQIAEFVQIQGWDAFAGDPAKLPLAAVDLHDLPGLDDTPGAGAGKWSWASAELEGTALHVTLVPPVGAADEARAMAMSALQVFHGQRVRVELSGYRLAVRSLDAVGIGREEACGFWECSRLDGLPPEAQLPSQRVIYHVTDLAALGGGRKPKTSADILRELRGLGPTEFADELSSRGWTVHWFPLQTPLIVEAFVTIHW